MSRLIHQFASRVLHRKHVDAKCKQNKYRSREIEIKLKTSSDILKRDGESGGFREKSINYSNENRKRKNNQEGHPNLIHHKIRKVKNLFNEESNVNHRNENVPVLYRNARKHGVSLSLPCSREILLWNSTHIHYIQSVLMEKNCSCNNSQDIVKEITNLMHHVSHPHQRRYDKKLQHLKCKLLELYEQCQKSVSQTSTSTSLYTTSNEDNSLNNENNNTNDEASTNLDDSNNEDNTSLDVDSREDYNMNDEDYYRVLWESRADSFTDFDYDGKLVDYPFLGY